MAQWQRKLDISDVMEEVRAAKIDIKTAAALISTRLATLAPFNDEELDRESSDLAMRFLDCEEDSEEFDSLLYELYEWADTPLDNRFNGRKVCWVESA